MIDLEKELEPSMKKFWSNVMDGKKEIQLNELDEMEVPVKIKVIREFYRIREINQRQVVNE